MRRIAFLLPLVFAIAESPLPPISIGAPVILTPGYPAVAIGFWNSGYPILLDTDGARKSSMLGVCAEAAAFDADGQLFLGCGPDLAVLKEGKFASSNIFHGQPLRDTISSIAAAPNGEIFALTASSDVLEISADRSSVQRIALPEIGFPVVHANIDLAPDGCTLYYLTHAGGIGRYDVCSHTQLPAFLPGGGFVSLRILGDGGVVAAPPDGRLRFYDPAGRLFKTIAVSGSPITSIAFDADPTHVWTASLAYVAKTRISDGRATVQEPYVTSTIIVRGERRPTTLGLTGIGRRQTVRH